MKNFVLAACFFCLSSAFAGNIVGTVQYKGPKVKPASLRMNADPVCVQQNKGKTIVNENLLVSASGGLENVFVYIKENVPKTTPSPAALEPLIFDQQGCRYTPRVIGVRVGQVLQIKNSDPTLHNVHALSKANPAFNLGMPTIGVLEKKFEKPEMAIRVKCDVHGWMNAYVHVLDHPYFAVTGNKGDFQIKNVPAGKYVLEFWHEKLGVKSLPLEVSEGKDAKAKMEMGG